jgi:hypothetical protein
MASQKPLRKKSLFENPRYWYHISTTLKHKREYLTPWDNSKGFNRSSSEPDVKRTCVGPTVAHCFAAVPYCSGEKYIIYRTAQKVKATQARGVYDANVTCEGWIQTPSMFVRIGTLSLRSMTKKIGKGIIDECASGSDTRWTGKVLAWWKRQPLYLYIKQA